MDHVRGRRAPKPRLDGRRPKTTGWPNSPTSCRRSTSRPTGHAPQCARLRGQEVLPIGEDLYRSIKHLGVGLGATLYVILLAGFQVLIHRLTGQTDLAIGIPSPARPVWKTGS